MAVPAMGTIGRVAIGKAKTSPNITVTTNSATSTVIGFSAMACGSGHTVLELTPTTIALGSADRQASLAIPIGGTAITPAGTVITKFAPI
jgi:hypothetical protein